MTTAAPKRASARSTKPAEPKTQRNDQRVLQLATQDQDARVPEEDRAVTVNNEEVVAPLCEKMFRIDLDTGLMPLMEWAAANDSENPENAPQLAALFYLLKDVVHPDDWDAFRKHARDSRAKGPDFVKFQNAAAEAIAAVPTEQPASS